MDYCPKGDLFDNITQGKRKFDHNLIREFLLQILDAVAHCHRLGIYYMDLKLENILVSGNHILLTGFGIAREDDTAFFSGSSNHASPGTH